MICLSRVVFVRFLIDPESVHILVRVIYGWRRRLGRPIPTDQCTSKGRVLFGQRSRIVYARCQSFIRLPLPEVALRVFSTKPVTHAEGSRPSFLSRLLLRH